MTTRKVPKVTAKKAAAKRAAPVKATAAKKVAKAKATSAKKVAKKVAKVAPAKAVAKVSALRGSSLDAYIRGKCSGWQAEAVRGLAGLISRVVPKAVQTIKWAQPVFELAGPFAFIRPAARHVTLGFWRGADMKDPRGVLEGDGSRMKHIKLRSAELDEKLLGGFIREAVALNAAHGDPTKRS